jgi:alkanesulfonate monooxygenase SsuD/methylene tetrahydromethanopterin reductase-like flavin-dependent oxidoreductase (luciferase family)
MKASTHKIMLGTYVLCNQFRHPSLLAKMASTLDNISKGRLELGIGAGWLRNEHIAFGFYWNKHSARVERLSEAIEIIKKRMSTLRLRLRVPKIVQFQPDKK